MTTQVKLGCTGKKRFAGFGMAHKTARRINGRDQGAHVEPYHCRHCHGFHVGENNNYGQKDKRKEVMR